MGVVNAAIGLLLYLAMALLEQRRGPGDLSLRGLIFATLLVEISLPAVLIIMAMGQQLTTQTISQFRTSLELQAQTLAYVLPPASRAIPSHPALSQSLAGLVFEVEAADGAQLSLDVITISDTNGRPTYISPSVEKVRGWSVAEAMTMPMDQHLKPDGCAYVIAALERTLAAVNQGLPLPTFLVELEQSHKTHGWIWTDVTSSCIVDEEDNYIDTMIVYRDITERKRLEGQLLQRASVDDLTGLLNRHELLEQLETLLSDARRRQDDQLALLFLDLDMFKEINDNLGHAAGDTVLRAVAERVRQRLRATDLAARMGGDEIVVVLRGLTDLAEATAVAETIVTAIEQPIQGSDFQITISASMGVTLARPGEPLDDLIARADTAMYQAKQSGRRRIMPIA